MFCRIDNQNRLCLPLDIIKSVYPDFDVSVYKEINIFLTDMSIKKLKEEGLIKDLTFILSFEDLSFESSSIYCLISHTAIDNKGRFTFSKNLRKTLLNGKPYARFIVYIKNNLIHLVYNGGSV